MRFKKPLVIGTAAVAVLASVTGAALASGKGSKAPSKPAAAVTTADSDNIQEGDQTSPDNGIQAPEANATATSAKAGVKAAASTRVKPADENSGEGENAGESDGPGGHQDPPGQDVNHEFNGQE
jgi:hypothetical protein